MPNEKEVKLKPVQEKSETITITRDQLKAFVQDEVAKAIGSKIEKPKRVTDRVAVIRIHEGKPVVSLNKVRERLVDGRQVAFCKIQTLGSPEEIEVGYLDFLNEAEKANVKILSQKATESVKSYGTIKAINPDPMNIKEWNGGNVDLEVTSVQYQAEIEVIDGDLAGQKYSVPTSCLNI